jgi:hypothetical protein
MVRDVQPLLHMTFLPVTALEVNSLLGEVDPLVVERILEVGATFDEFAEALSAAEDEAAYGEVPHVPSSPRVLEVRHILDELVLDEDDEELPIASDSR